MANHSVILVGRKTYRSVAGAARFYGVSRQLLLRRIADERWQFPRPDKLWRGIRFWSERTLRNYDVTMRPVCEEELEPFNEPWPPRGASVAVIEPMSLVVGPSTEAADGLEQLRRRLADGPGTAGSEG
jgi:hypothetical protein